VIQGDAEAHRACVRSVAAAAQAAGADPMKAVDAWSEAIQSAPRPAALPLQPIHGRSRTPLRRPSAPLQFMTVAAPAAPQAQEPSPPNTPIEELVIEDC
jgi:hypothetical protein